MSEIDCHHWLEPMLEKERDEAEVDQAHANAQDEAQQAPRPEHVFYPRGLFSGLFGF